MHKYCVPMNFFPHGSDELFVGRAGFLAACHILNKRIGRTIVSDETVLPLCNTIIESGKRTAQLQDSECPLMYTYYNTNYLGQYFCWFCNISVSNTCHVFLLLLFFLP